MLGDRAAQQGDGPRLVLAVVAQAGGELAAPDPAQQAEGGVAAGLC